MGSAADSWSNRSERSASCDFAYLDEPFEGGRRTPTCKYDEVTGDSKDVRSSCMSGRRNKVVSLRHCRVFRAKNAQTVVTCKVYKSAARDIAPSSPFHGLNSLIRVLATSGVGCLEAFTGLCCPVASR